LLDIITKDITLEITPTMRRKVFAAQIVLHNPETIFFEGCRFNEQIPSCELIKKIAAKYLISPEYPLTV